MRNWTPTLSGDRIDAPGTVLEPIGRRFADAPDRAAVGGLTYGELDAASARVAGGLIAAGVGRGEPVLVHTGTSVWAVVAVLGVLRAGACFAIIDADLPSERRARMIESSRSRWIMGEPGRELDDAARAALAKLHAAAVDTDDAAPRTVAPTASDPAYLSFTDAAQAVVVGHGALAHSTAARSAHYPGPVRGLATTAIAGVFWAMADGGALLLPSDDPGPRASHALLTPSAYAAALDRCPAVTAVILTGEECPPELVRRHFETRPEVALHIEYGHAETAGWATVHRCTPDDHELPIGAPIPGVHLYLRDGDLWIGGPTIAAGYLDGSNTDHARFRIVNGERCFRGRIRGEGREKPRSAY